MAAGRDGKASAAVGARTAQDAHLGLGIYAGLFCVTLATLMLEILLTRIFSVILWYHFAFVAVSVALFGMTLGAVIVHLAPRFFSGPLLAARLAGASSLFGLTTAGALAAILTMKLTPPGAGSQITGLVPVYLIVAVPFTFSGIVVSAVLTRFPERVNRLYAADLVGAAIGCAGVIFALRILDAPSAVIAVGAAAGGGALFFSLVSRGRWTRLAAGALVLGLAALAVFNAHSKVLRVRWVKGERAHPVVYETWNAFSRITVSRFWDLPIGIYGTERVRSYRIEQLWLEQDGHAPTVLTRFDGDFGPVGYLPDDLAATAYWLRPNADILVIGVGGGRDVLTALVMQQKSVTGVELNPDIVHAVNDRFGEFTGHLGRFPNVRLVTDEARSWIDRSTQKFDIIQCSGIDTFAATAAGALALSENVLYTREAWTSLLSHLTDRGILSVGRFYFQHIPGETLRCVSLARASLEQLGVRDPRRHVAVLRCMRDDRGHYSRDGHGRILVSRSPFSDEDARRLEEHARRMGFELMLSPTVCKNTALEMLLSPSGHRGLIDALPLDVSAPTDDRPFFFQMLRFRDWATPQPADYQGVMSINLHAVSVLGQLLVTTVALAVLFLLLPLAVTYRRDRYSLRSLAPALLFFAAIGLGFMLVEISQMQRLIIFLGHPTYGLSVVLFALLGASGLGSLVTGGISLDSPRAAWRIAAIMGGLLALLILFGFTTPALTQAARPWPTAQRILLAVALLAPIAFLMGAPFPLAMKLASRLERSPTAWYWGVNGAMSVVASVAAAALSLAAGITATFFAGVVCYVCAAVLLFILHRQT